MSESIIYEVTTMNSIHKLGMYGGANARPQVKFVGSTARVGCLGQVFARVMSD